MLAIPNRLSGGTRVFGNISGISFRSFRTSRFTSRDPLFASDRAEAADTQQQEETKIPEGAQGRSRNSGNVSKIAEEDSKVDVESTYCEPQTTTSDTKLDDEESKIDPESAQVEPQIDAGASKIVEDDASA